jgi:hypothetical protein
VEVHPDNRSRFHILFFSLVRQFVKGKGSDLKKNGQIFEIDKIKKKRKPKLVPSLAQITAPSARAGRV